jgi:hypothetical protein
MDPNVKLETAKNWGGQELDKESSKSYHAIVRSFIDTVLATWPDISYAVAVLC